MPSPTRFGSLASHEKGRVEPIADDVRHYAFSNCFDIAAGSRPYERVVFGQNQGYTLEVVRAEGDSPWYGCGHDEFVLCMDGELTVELARPGAHRPSDRAARQGAILLGTGPQGQAMGWMRLKRGHQGMLPAGCAYRFRADAPAVLVLQTCKGELSVEKWAEICQTR